MSERRREDNCTRWLVASAAEHVLLDSHDRHLLMGVDNCGVQFYGVVRYLVETKTWQQL